MTSDEGLGDVDREKKAAAFAAIDLVEEGMLVGLGSGSTAAFAVQALGARVARGLTVRAVATSTTTRALAEAARIPLAALADVGELDLTIDGADEIDPALRLIKGAGGALLYEKIVAASSRRFVIIADARKRVARLGAVPVPVEVVPFALPLVQRRLRALDVEAVLRVRAGTPFVTDGGHHILDLRGRGLADDPDALARRLDDMVGVVEHGLFIGYAERALIATGTRVDAIVATR